MSTEHTSDQIQDIVEELETELGLESEEEAAADQLGGFDIGEQKEKAKEEDKGVTVQANGVDGKPMFYRDPHTNELKPVVFVVAGSNSSQYRRAEAEQRKRKLKASNLTGESIFKDQLDKVIACLIHFEGFYVTQPDRSKKHIAFSASNARVIFKACPWLLDQVTEAMNDHERFFSRG